VTAPGPLADEARLLVEAAREWAARAFPEAGEHLATCQWCPLCRGVAALRSPDVADKVTAAVTTAAAALAAILDAVSTPPEGTSTGTGRPAPAETAAAASAGPPAPAGAGAGPAGPQAAAPVPGPPAFASETVRQDIPID